MKNEYRKNPCMRLPVPKNASRPPHPLPRGVCVITACCSGGPRPPLLIIKDFGAHRAPLQHTKPSCHTDSRGEGGDSRGCVSWHGQSHARILAAFILHRSRSKCEIIRDYAFGLLVLEFLHLRVQSFTLSSPRLTTPALTLQWMTPLPIPSTPRCVASSTCEENE